MISQPSAPASNPVLSIMTARVTGSLKPAQAKLCETGDGYDKSVLNPLRNRAENGSIELEKSPKIPFCVYQGVDESLLFFRVY